MATALILKIRAEALRTNLKHLKSHLSDMPDPKENFAKVENGLAEAKKSLGSVLRTVSNTRISIEIQTDASPESEPLKEAEQQLRNVITNLTEAGKLIKSMRDKCARICDSDIGKKILEVLNTKADPSIQKLIDMEAKLLVAPANLQKNWHDFQTQAKDVNQSIFEQYVEFLGGLALRDAGYDAGISMDADALLCDYSKQNRFVPMLAIPTRQQAVAMTTLARIIRVTFPEWTIWALPSTACEFWNVIARNDFDLALTSALQSVTKNDDDKVDERFTICLADAFATFTMGPAYAYYAFFLLLDPLSPFNDGDNQVCADVRAHGILQMLEHMDSKENQLDPPYAEARQELDASWQTAISQTGANLASAEEKNRVVSDKARLSLHVQALWKTLNNSASPFTSDVWREIKQWVEPLLRDDVAAIRVPQGAELRHVLNAAWLARVNPNRNPDFDLTAAAVKLAKRIIKTDRG